MTVGATCMRTLTALAIAQVALYGLIAWQARHFEYATSLNTRPMLSVLALFGLAFLVYLLSLMAALKAPPSRYLAFLLLVFGLVYRILLLPTPPIQEVDIYRYLWDGAVTSNGLSPYRYAPAQVLERNQDGQGTFELMPYLQVRDRTASLGETLSRIHYPELTTIYPPVSQVVFAIGDRLTPRHASLRFRLILLKAVLLLFDLGTILLLLALLKALSWHPGWGIAYAWCPLVIKEFANSGHLDSIAVFFTAAAALSAIRTVNGPSGRRSAVFDLGPAILLSLAVGVKLYPLVLLPVFFATTAANGGLRRGIVFAVITSGLSLALVLPMFMFGPSTHPLQEPVAASTPAVVPSEHDDQQSISLLPPPAEQSTGEGLSTFLTRWEMNDFLFMVVLENLRPESARPHTNRPWFVVIPDAWRSAMVTPLADCLEWDTRSTSFLMTRVLTTLVLGIIAIGLSWRVYRLVSKEAFLEACFLTLAWLWLLSPTQNPWYWTWALPFVPFARSRLWLVVSGLVMTYYVRFWLQTHYPHPPALGTSYSGAEFFDFVVVPVEFLPWMVLLAIASMWQGAKRRPVAFCEK